MILDLLASLSFYAVPFLTGRLITKKISSAFAIGALFWFIIFFFLSKANLTPAFFTILIKILVIGIVSVSSVKLGFDLFRSKLELPDKELVFLFIFSLLIYFLIWKAQTPYPYALNWDIYEHITLAHEISSSGRFSFFTTQLSDTFTFNSYPPLFHILLALPKLIFNANLLGVYWYLEYWFYLLTILASYFLTKNLFEQKYLAIFSATIGGLIFQSQMAYSPFFLLPQTLAALLIIATLSEIVKEEKIQIFPLVAASVTIFFLHYLLGSSGIITLLIFPLFKKIHLSLKAKRIITITTLLILILVLLLHSFGSWNLTQREEAFHFRLPLDTLMAFLFDWYGILLPIFFPIGVLLLWRSKNNFQTLFLSTTFLLSAIALAPFSYVLKVFALAGYFVNTVVSYGVYYSLDKLPRKLHPFGVAWIFLAFLTVFITNKSFYKEPLNFKGIESNVSKLELKAADWLVQNAPPNSLLISDPATQYILEALSGVNSQGGAFMDLTTRETLTKIQTVTDIEDLKKTTQTIRDKLPTKKTDHRLLILSGRYFLWQRFPQDWKLSTFYNIWKPESIPKEGKEYIDFLKAQKAEVLYENEELLIIQL